MLAGLLAPVGSPLALSPGAVHPELAALLDEVLDSFIDGCAKVGRTGEMRRFEAIRRGQ